jgi:hypothetical protein
LENIQNILIQNNIYFIILYYYIIILLYYIIILYYINILQTIGMNYIINPDTLESYSIFSEKGLKLLKEYVRVYQEGGEGGGGGGGGGERQIVPASAAAANPCPNVNANNMQLYRTETVEMNNDMRERTRIAATLKLIRVDHTHANCAESINLRELLRDRLNNYVWDNIGGDDNIRRNVAQGILVSRILRDNINIIQVPAEYARNAPTLGDTNLEAAGVGEGFGFVLRQID